MTFRFSTGTRQSIAGSTGLRSAFANGIIEIYDGPQPLSADNAVSGTLLMRITLASGAFTPGTSTNGINFDAPVAGLLSKAAAETWSGIGLAIGTAGWFRFKANAVDSGGSSTTALRMDGSIAITGGDLNLSNISITVGSPEVISLWSINFLAQKA